MNRPSSEFKLRALDPGKPEGHGAIREQLARLLDCPLFRTSKRYPDLLRFVVESTLAGRAFEIKERTLGVRVFGRPEDYVCSLDPIVRISAGEIRKRIAQYYHDPRHQGELRINLPVGSYVPEFHEAPPPARITSTATDSFWRPVLEDGDPVLICIGREPGPPGIGNAIVWEDVVALIGLIHLFESRRHPYHVERDDLTSFAALQQGPAVLIGGFHHAWAPRLVGGGPFRFEREGARLMVADDGKGGNSRLWSIDVSQADSSGRPPIDVDYAIVSRVASQTTGRYVVSACGLSCYGTQAAARFLTHPGAVETLAGEAPLDWEKKNLQVVLRSEVIDQTAGPPRVIATRFW